MEKIVQIGINRLKQQKREQISFVNDPKSNELLNDIENNPHVFVLGCLMDRLIKAEKAWMIPQRVFEELGTHDFYKLANIEEETYKTIFQQKKLHRFNTEMATNFFLVIQEIKQKYHGNASEIWDGKPSSSSVVFRFLEFKGCGIKIATMATNILARQFKIEFSDYFSIDISPDVHVRRVLSRMGYVIHDPSPELVIYKARELYPEFPGIIDLSCFEIGRTWCRPTNPDCSNCIIKDECKKCIMI
jgi:endonuclease III